MSDADPSPWKICFGKLRLLIGITLSPPPHHIHIMAQIGKLKLRLVFQNIICVHKQNVIPLALSKVVRLGAIFAKIPPRTLVKLPRNLFQMFFDDVLRSVGRARIDNDPIVDQRHHRV